MWLLPIFLAIISSIGASEVAFSEFSRGMQSFASNFYHEVVRPESKNVVVSPYSVVSALAFLAQGTEGESFEQIRRGLHLRGEKADMAENYLEYDDQLEHNAGKVSFSVANQIFVQKNIPLNKNFEDVAKKHFLSGVQTVDFSNSAEAASTINHFVAEKTHDKIKELVNADSLIPAPRVTLINAIYMKAKWDQAFPSYNTYKRDFFANEKDKTSVDFMHTTEEFSYSKWDSLKMQILEMKYAESDLSMLILLPDSRTGLSELDTELHGYNLDKMFDTLEKKRVDVTIPKFKIEHTVELNDVLKRMGISDIFDAGKANLSGMLESNEPLSISKAIHKAFIEIDEEGTEAAAVTGFFTVGASAFIEQDQPPKFVADHPFVYHIWDRKLKMPIFSGHVTRIE